MKKKIHIGIMDKENNLINNMYLNEVPLYEEYVLATSKDEYSNEEPCIVIRTCIRNNVYKSFAKYLKSRDSKLKGQVYVNDLPDEYEKSMDFGEDASIITYERRG